MPWVLRNPDNSIRVAYGYRQDDLAGLEQVADDAAELVAFLNRPAVPAEISRRQCARAMYARGLISVAEAKAMTKSGDMPAMVAAMVAQMPAGQRDIAEIDFAADTYLRTNPLLIALMTATGASSADIDAFFVQAAAL